MSILNAISSAFKGKKAPDSTKISELLAQAENETAVARKRLAELEEQRPEMALADESDRRRFRAELAETREFVEGGEDAIVALRDRHRVAMESEAEDGRKQAYKAAMAKADELPKLIDEYGRLAQSVRDVVAKIAEIDAIVKVANTDLPADTARIASSSELRSIPFLPREIISEKVVPLWLRPGSSDPLGEPFLKEVRTEDNGSAYMHRDGVGAVYLRKAFFTRREYREAVTAVHATGFDKIVLPDARVAKRSKERPMLVEHVPYREVA